MATPDETAVDETPATPIAERLGLFMRDHYAVLDHDRELDPAIAEQLAEYVLRDFFRVDVEATSIYALSRVDHETLEPFAMVHWGPMAGRLRPDELRAIGAAFVEVAETADVEATFVNWLLKDPGSTRDGAAKILNSFRSFRAELAGVEDPAGD